MPEVKFLAGAPIQACSLGCKSVTRTQGKALGSRTLVGIYGGSITPGLTPNSSNADSIHSVSHISQYIHTHSFIHSTTRH